MWLLPYSDLTPDQQMAVELPIDTHKVIIGPPGSGKTQILIHRAAHIVNNFNLKEDEYKIFVFTNVVKNYIKSGINFLNLPETVVSTFDHWCRIFYEKNIGPLFVVHDKSFFKRVRKKVLDFLKLNPSFQRRLSFVMVDEGQDLSPECYEIMLLIAKHITVFVDPKQKIFEGGASEEFIRNKLNLKSYSFYFLNGYRNSPNVAKLASYFIEDEKEREKYLNQVYAIDKIREIPLLYISSDFEDEMENLAKIIRQRLILNERIGIIVPTKKILKEIYENLKKRKIPVEKALATHLSHNTCDFNNSSPKISTFHSAKGLTFDAVLIPSLTEKAISWIDERVRKNIFFVGISRAVKWVYISTLEEEEPEEFNLLKEAEKNGDLVIKRYDEDGISFKMTEEDEDDFSVL